MNYCNKSFLVKKLLYQSKSRGCKETGLILGKFAELFLNKMNEKELEEFSLILKQNDIDIYGWITNKATLPKNLHSDVMLQLIDFEMILI